MRSVRTAEAGFSAVEEILDPAEIEIRDRALAFCQEVT
jgi:hypothetical protein